MFSIIISSSTIISIIIAIIYYHVLLSISSSSSSSNAAENQRDGHSWKLVGHQRKVTPSYSMTIIKCYPTWSTNKHLMRLASDIKHLTST